MITCLIPSHAQEYIYRQRNFNFKYWIWEKSGKWYWATVGNDGIEDTREEATVAARKWIKYGNK